MGAGEFRAVDLFVRAAVQVRADGQLVVEWRGAEFVNCQKQNGNNPCDRREDGRCDIHALSICFKSLMKSKRPPYGRQHFRGGTSTLAGACVPLNIFRLSTVGEIEKAIEAFSIGSLAAQTGLS